MVGIQSHGRGGETALSQVAAEELGIDPAHPRRIMAAIGKAGEAAPKL
jgi:CO/xanthine dehydrogenase Mo-binding subunit